MTFTVQQSIAISVVITVIVIGSFAIVRFRQTYCHKTTASEGIKQAWYDFTRNVFGPIYYIHSYSCDKCGRIYFTARSAENCCKNKPKKRIDGGYSDAFMDAWIQNNIHDQDNR